MNLFLHTEILRDLHVLAVITYPSTYSSFSSWEMSLFSSCHKRRAIGIWNTGSLLYTGFSSTAGSLTVVAVMVLDVLTISFPLTSIPEPLKVQNFCCCIPSSFTIPRPFHSFERTHGLWLEFQMTEKCQVETHSHKTSTFIMCIAIPGKQDSSLGTLDKGYIMV